MASTVLFQLFVLCYFSHVFVQSSPTINGPPLHVPVQVNGSATLHCSSSDASSPVKWYRGSPFTGTLFPINTSGDNPFSSTSTNLTITGFTNHDHGGEYLCKAESDSNALLSCPATVDLADISTVFVSEPSDTTVTIGTMTVLKCSPPKSNPPADVYWLKDDGLFLMDPFMSIQTAAGNLYLLNATEDDGGQYQCVAENKVTGVKRYTRKAKLTVVDHSISNEPSFLITPSNKTVPLNGIAEFECFVNHNSDIIWEWVGHDSLPATSVVDDLGVLVIFGVSGAHNGAMFRCSLVTGQQVLVLNTVHLTVTTSLKLIIVGQLYGKAATSTTLFCVNQESSLTGEVSVAWLVDGSVVKQEQTFNGASSHTFDIVSDSSEMWIQCMMMSEHGCSEKTVVFEVEEPATPPSLLPPLSFFLSPTTDPLFLPNTGSLNLTCSILLNQEVSFLNIQWEDSSNQTVPSTTQNVGSRFHTAHVTVTLPGTYKCEVVLFTGLALQKFTESIVVHAVTVDTATPTSSPQPSTTSGQHNLTTVPIATTTPTPVQPAVPPTNHPGNLSLSWFGDILLVSWTHPPMDNTNIIGYKLNWGVANKYLAQVALRAVPYDSPWFVIDELDKNSGTEYQVMVWAYSISGDGPSTVISTDQATELTDHTAPTVIPTTNTSSNSSSPSHLDSVMVITPCASILPDLALIGVQFTDFHPSLINDFHHFVISYSCDSAGTNETITRRTLPLLLENLQPGCSYNVTVSVVNGQGQSIIAPESCSFKAMEEGGIPIVFDVQWNDPFEGSVSIKWSFLPLSVLHVLPDVSIEAYINREWSVIENGHHLSLDPNEESLIMVRVFVSKIIIYSESITVPALFVDPSPFIVNTTTSPSSSVSINSPWITYGVGFCSVLLSIIVALSFVLVLKHIQAKRRQENQNLKQNYHKRLPSLSSQKSLFSSRDDSTQSIKNKASSLSAVQTSTTVNDIYTHS